MCMTVAQAKAGAGSFVATDTQRLIFLHELTGEIILPGYPLGGRIISTGSGWATATGASGAVCVALRALKDAGPSVRDPLTRRRQHPTDRTRLTLAPALAAAGITPTEERNRFEVRAIDLYWPDCVTSSNGAICATERGGLHLTLPPGYSRETFTQLLERMYADIEPLDDMADRIKVVARYFHEVSSRVQTVSRVMEVGYILPSPSGWRAPTLGFLAGPAREIADAEPGEILDHFRVEHSNADFEEMIEVETAALGMFEP